MRSVPLTDEELRAVKRNCFALISSGPDIDWKRGNGRDMRVYSAYEIDNNDFGTNKNVAEFDNYYNENVINHWTRVYNHRQEIIIVIPYDTKFNEN